MQDLYNVTYDISDPKRLQRAFKTIQNYGDHLRLPVFECRLSRAYVAVQVLFTRLGPAASQGDEPAIGALERPYAPRDCRVVVL